MMEYNVEIETTKEGLIIRKLINAKALELSRRVMDTQEEGTKKALIRLGWTPPKKERVEK